MSMPLNGKINRALEFLFGLVLLAIGGSVVFLPAEGQIIAVAVLKLLSVSVLMVAGLWITLECQE